MFKELIQSNFKVFNRNNLIGYIGSFAEAYNTSVYAFSSTFIATSSFDDKIYGLFYTHLIISVAVFLAYPAGSIVYGIIGDKDGRKVACISSTFFLGLSIGGIALVPENTEFSWMLYFALSFFTSFFTAAEHRSSIIFAIEHTDKSKQYLSSGIVCLFAVIGILAAKSFTVLCAHPNLWKIPFLLGAIIGFFTYMCRKYCCEPNVLKDKNKVDFPSLLRIIKMRTVNIIETVIASAFFGISYNYVFVIAPIVFINIDITSIYLLILYGVLLVAFAYIAQRLNPYKVMFFGALGFAISVVPLSFMIQDHPFLSITPVLIFMCMFIGPKHTWFNNQFIEQERCRGSMLSSAFSCAIFYGTSSSTMLLIHTETQSFAWCGAYSACFAIFAAIVLFRSARRNGVDMLYKPNAKLKMS